MGIIGDILEVAKMLFDLRNKLSKAKKERKQAVADYYNRIADTLKHVVVKLRANEVPHGDCEKVLTYAEQLPETIGDLIGNDVAIELSKKLANAHEVELLLYQLDAATDREAQLAQLEKASGYFEASADSLRAGR
jgi:hypothetical protein